jgi:hypothetical protein
LGGPYAWPGSWHVAHDIAPDADSPFSKNSCLPTAAAAPSGRGRGAAGPTDSDDTGEVAAGTTTSAAVARAAARSSDREHAAETSATNKIPAFSFHIRIGHLKA